MSSFQLNLSSLTLGAKERLVRLEASAGGTIRSRLLSPSSAPAPSVASALVGSVADAPGPVGADTVSLVDVLDVGVPGEYPLSRGVAGGLPVFVMMPDLMSSMCCGAVGGGLKFCTLGVGSCSFALHVIWNKVTCTFQLGATVHYLLYIMHPPMLFPHLS